MKKKFPHSLEKKTAVCRRETAKCNRRFSKFHPENSALLVVDMQDFFLAPESEAFVCGSSLILGNVRLLLEAFRRAGRPVVYTVYVSPENPRDRGLMGRWWKRACVEGSPGSKICDLVEPKPGEHIIKKNCYSAFFQTGLEGYFRELGVNEVAVAGVMTNLCVESSVRDAFQRNILPFTIMDAVAAKHEDLHLASLKNLACGFSHVVNTEWLLKAFASPAFPSDIQSLCPINLL